MSLMGKQKGLAPILIVILVAILGIGGYFIYSSSSLGGGDEAGDVAISPTSTPISNSSPTPSARPADPTVNWKTYTGNYVTFKYPNDWLPKNREMCCGEMLEAISLGIPGISKEQAVSFSPVNFEGLKPVDIVSEKQVTISNQPGLKWVRKGENYVAYDYCTNGHFPDAGNFCLHVLATNEEKNLENQLDVVAQSVTFK